ncbi:OLC1v1019235C4 [Oldenlandia corymbosa var. corymbosa]|uniref:OLC1v1019235C4 n=1 Tax=Oldenlandia corymbosa var. corymbosa TaxID=529605 RepID=A0AAV1EDH8_OLDCO|nr:OLC1v1019235C4 [Oldenlandia corymbosa var. corymbosa]
MDGVIHNLNLLVSLWNKYIEKKKSGRLMHRARRLFEPTYNYDQLSRSLTENVNQIHQDWIFLKMLVKSVYSSDAPVSMQNVISVIEKIDRLAHEIFCYTSFCLDQYKKYYLKKPQEILSLLCDCQRKTDVLVEVDIREALKDLSKLEFHARSPDSYFWKSFFPAVEFNLWWSFKDDKWFSPFVEENLWWSFEDEAGDSVLFKKLRFLHSELKSIRGYLGRHDYILGNLTSHVRDDHGVDAFLTHVASVVLRIAIQCCNFWFNRNDPQTAKGLVSELVDLHHQISLANPEFVQWYLRFQGSLYKFNSNISEEDGSASVILFCRYLLNSLANEDLMKELVNLVTLSFNSTIEDGEEDVDHFFAEIRALLAEATFYNRMVPQDRPPDSELDMILTDLTGYSKDLCQQSNTEFVKQSLVLTEELAHEVELFQEQLHSKKLPSPSVKHSLLQWLFRIIFFKAELYLTELLKSNDTTIAHRRDQLQCLVEELIYLKRIVETKLPRNSLVEESFMIQLEAFARGITLLSYTYLPSNMKLEKMVLSLPQLMDKMNIIKSTLREISQQFPKCIFPKTYGVGFLNYLCRNLCELLKRDLESITPAKHHFEEVLLRLESLKSFLEKVKDSDVQLAELKDVEERVIGAAYKLEYVVDSIEVDGHLQQSLWFCDVLEEIRCVHQQVLNTHEMSNTGEVEKLPLISSPIVLRDATPEINEQLVDLLDEETIIVDRLTRGSSQRDVVSIVGMPGIGKTTIARKVYNNPNVACHFHSRAWCNVSQTYLKRELLLELLSNLAGLTDDMVNLTDDDLLSKLRRCLLKNKYMIVMDDIWDTTAWNDLENCFPDDHNGSRILITSRRQDVASEIRPYSDPYPIRPFSDEESWILLKYKIFKGAADCPEDLLEVAKEESFHHLVSRHDEPYASLPDSEYDMDLDSENVVAPTIFNSYRLSFCVKRPQFIDSRPSGPLARSLTFFPSSDSEPKCPYDLSFICHNFKLLRILDLESIMSVSFPVEIGLMIHLRYLAVSGYMKSIPPFISKLWKLETLVVKGLRKVILPGTIWSMVRLRHLHVNNHAIFSLPGIDEAVGNSPHLEKLISFSTPSLSSKDDRWRILKRMPNLLKLRCIFWKSEVSSESGSEFIRWNFLTHLESLKIICFGGSPTSYDFLLPQSLKKLTLSKFCLQENHLSVIGALPNLEVLKLHAGTFQGQKWDMREDEFEELKYLELDAMNLVEWDASYDHLPRLQQLILSNCKDLQRIPSDFAHIATLQKVEVHWCRKSVEASAEEIGDETQEIKVVINR